MCIVSFYCFVAIATHSFFSAEFIHDRIHLPCILIAVQHLKTIINITECMRHSVLRSRIIYCVLERTARPSIREASHFLSSLLDTDDALPVVMGAMQLLPNLRSKQLLVSDYSILQEIISFFPSIFKETKKNVASYFMTFSS